MAAPPKQDLHRTDEPTACPGARPKTERLGGSNQELLQVIAGDVLARAHVMDEAE